MGLKKLNILHMKRNKLITDKGLKYLKDLIDLDLMKNENITLKGIVHFWQIEGLNLKYNRNITELGHLKRTLNLFVYNFRIYYKKDIEINF
jgi:hypothetical protein